MQDSDLDSEILFSAFECSFLDFVSHMLLVTNSLAHCKLDCNGSFVSTVQILFIHLFYMFNIVLHFLLQKHQMLMIILTFLAYGKTLWEISVCQECAYKLIPVKNQDEQYNMYAHSQLLLILKRPFLFLSFKLTLCYHPLKFFFINTTLNWNDASTYCKQHHDSLATIKSMVENNQLATFPAGGWIGLADLPKNPWQWIGSGSRFTNWATGQPDNNNGVEHCAIMDADSLWRDENCELARPFYCRHGEAGFIFKVNLHMLTFLPFLER
uniref:C-type lectin domain-containing protein n=1 Tax=Neogobius melanostomus TaxID=47308 RepID=A0A8C6SE95_9GOBI